MTELSSPHPCVDPVKLQPYRDPVDRLLKTFATSHLTLCEGQGLDGRMEVEMSTVRRMGLHADEGGNEMNPTIAVVEGTIKPDGTLELEDKVNLPAGKVQVTMVPIPELPREDPFWQLMQRIWAGQKARGHVPRNAEDVEAERKAVRDEWDERMSRIDRIRQEAERLRVGG